jgi:dihydrofolate reductase (trimethoprim resistance protein)
MTKRYTEAELQELLAAGIAQANEEQTIMREQLATTAAAYAESVRLHNLTLDELQTTLQTVERLLGTQGKFQLGDRVRKTKGSQWHGYIVGVYSTELTPEGYAVESATEHGSVQIYPAAALELWT